MAASLRRASSIVAAEGETRPDANALRHIHNARGTFCHVTQRVCNSDSMSVAAMATLLIPVLVCYYSAGRRLDASGSYKYVANVEYQHEASSSTVSDVETFFNHLAQSKPREFGISHTELESAEVSIRRVSPPFFSCGAHSPFLGPRTTVLPRCK